MQTNGNDAFTQKLFSPVRFGIFLALLVFAVFPQVILGLETFVAGDYGFFVFPLAHFQQQCFQHGSLPFWDPYNNCGVPFLAQLNTMPLYPPSLICLTLPLEWSLSFFDLMHLWFAGLGMYFLARRWTGNHFAAAFAGIVFTFNGYTLNLLTWPSHVATFAWMPWVILVAGPACREGGRKIILASFAGAMQLLAGGPETIFLTWLILSALWLQEFIQGGTFRGAMLWRYPLMIMLVILLTAAQLFPFLDLVAHSQRASDLADLRWSMPVTGWANFLVPMAFGATGAGGAFFQHGQFMTSSYYPGLGTIWLALLAMAGVRNRRVWLLGTVVAMGMILAFGENTPVLPVLRKLVPQLNLTHYPIKYIMLVAFAAPLLAAFAIANFKRTQKHIFVAGMILFFLMAGIVLWTQFAPRAGDNSEVALSSGFSRAAFLILTGLILFALTREMKTKLICYAPLLLILVVWVDLLTDVPVKNPTVPPWIYGSNLSREKLALNPQPSLGGSRAMVSPMAWYSFVYFSANDPKNNFLAKRLGYCANINLLDSVPKTDGFFSLTPHENDEVLSLFYTTTNASYPHLEDFMGVSQMTSSEAVFRWQARTNFLPLVTAGQRPVFLDDQSALTALAQTDFNGRKIVFLPREAKSFVTISNQTEAEVLNSKFGIDTVDIEADAAEPSLVVVAQTYYHNWEAEVDGKPARLFRANVAFQAVDIPAGRHQIHLAYRDHAFKAGALISLVAWLICTLVIAGYFTMCRSKPFSETDTGSETHCS